MSVTCHSACSHPLVTQVRSPDGRPTFKCHRCGVWFIR